MNRSTPHPLSRRTFLGSTMQAAASFAIVPSLGALSACGGSDSDSPSSTSPLTFTPATVAAVDALAAQCLQAFDTPGVGLALIQGGKIIYARGHGVRDLATGEPFTADT